MRVVVTGCAGFIGYHLSERLLSDGHEVVGVDNFASGSQRNAADLQGRSGFTFIEADISRAVTVAGPVQRIFNLACPASPVDFDKLALEIMSVCSNGVRNLLELAREKGARLLHTSTSEVYGDPHEHPQAETYRGNVSTLGPRACYDEGKRFAEALITNFVRRHGVEVRMVRIFNTYGPRMRADDGRALPTFIKQALRGEPVTIHGEGRQTRSFCYVSDQVDGILRLTESDVTGPVNIGNPEEVTIRQVAQEVVDLCGGRSTITSLPRPQDDPSRRCPDITRASTLLGWQPRVARRDGLQRTIEWFRQP
jgi:dTDP-glucose 4,6-dehydratase